MKVPAYEIQQVSFPSCAASLGASECEAVCPGKFPKVVSSEGREACTVSGEIND
jgi:hypothetical protein